MSTESRSAQVVTAGYLRMNDPGFVVRTLDRAQTPQGRRMAARLLPAEFIARRAEIVAANEKYLKLVSFPAEPITLGRQGEKESGQAPEPKGPGPIKIPGVVDVPMDFGSVSVNTASTAYSTLDYYGTALNDGSLTIDEPWNTPIEVMRVNIYSGEVKDGKPVLSSTNLGSAKGKTFKVKQGQEFLVRVRLSHQKAGSYSEAISIQETGRTLKLNAKGVVSPTSGSITSWIEEGDFYLIPGQPAQGRLHVKVAGDGPTTVQVGGLSTIPMVGITGGTAVAKPGEEIIIPFTVVTPKGKDNDSGLVTISAHAYAGKATTNATVSAKVETLWTLWKGFQNATGNVKTSGSFIYSSAGDWELTWSGVGTSKFVADDCYLLVRINTLTPKGTRLAAASQMRLEASLLTNDHDNATASGWDERLVGTQYVNSFLTATLIVTDWLFEDSEPKLKEWRTTNNVEWLNGTEAHLQSLAK